MSAIDVLDHYIGVQKHRITRVTAKGQRRIARGKSGTDANVATIRELLADAQRARDDLERLLTASRELRPLLVLPRRASKSGADERRAAAHEAFEEALARFEGPTQ